MDIRKLAYVFVYDCFLLLSRLAIINDAPIHQSLSDLSGVGWGRETNKKRDIYLFVMRNWTKKIEKISNQQLPSIGVCE
jgi:hypothetical protein